MREGRGRKVNTQDLFDLERCRYCKQLRNEHRKAGINIMSEDEFLSCVLSHSRIIDGMERKRVWTFYKQMTPLELAVWIEAQHETSRPKA